MANTKTDYYDKRDTANSDSIKKSTTFTIRQSLPSKGDSACKYYTHPDNGGIGLAVWGSPALFHEYLTCLSNCLGYAFGRFQEIYDEINNDGRKFTALGNSMPGEGTIENAKSIGLTVSNDPTPGGMLVYDGHVVICEKYNYDGSIDISESGYGNYFFEYHTVRKENNWGCGYQYRGCINNPAVPYGATNVNGIVGTSKPETGLKELRSNLELMSVSTLWNPYSWSIENVQSDELVTRDYIETSTESQTMHRGTNLLQYPSLIETPYIILEIGNYTFGSYAKQENKNTATVSYPNYIDSMTVKKTNGTVNQYTINMTYKIEFGADPNLLDKIFSSVGFGTVYISYGDWSSPNFIYKREEALITKITSNVDFGNSTIKYVMSCTSNAVSLSATSYSFGEYTGKPSTKIIDILKNSNYGFKYVFPGMYKNGVLDELKIQQNGWIKTDDKSITISPKESIDPLSYLNYLVSCMISSTNSSSAILQNSAYYMTIHDDGISSYGGAYFTVSKVDTELKSLTSIDTYTVDVGFPDIKNNTNNVFKFEVSNDNSWQLLYDYAEKLQTQEYVYKIDSDGKMYSEYSPGMATSISEYKMTPSQKTWWTQMTQFPLTTRLVLKGLVRSTMLMEYIRVNALFYGQKHISSGLYVVTAQEDSISKNGYRTTLTLLRIAGDDDYISRSTKTVTKNVEQIALSENHPKLTGRWEVKARKNRVVSVEGYDHTYTDEDGNTIYVFTDIESYKKAMDANREWFIPLIQNYVNLVKNALEGDNGGIQAIVSNRTSSNLIPVSQFIRDMKHIALYRTTKYDNEFPYNSGFISQVDYGNGNKGPITISFDCINLIKAYINDPAVTTRLTVGTYVKPGQVIGDIGGGEMLAECSSVNWGRFNYCVPGSLLIMYAGGVYHHAGVYVGDFTYDSKTYNVVECTTAFGDGVVPSYMDSEGRRYSHKGGTQTAEYPWNAWGKMTKYIKY